MDWYVCNCYASQSTRVDLQVLLGAGLFGVWNAGVEQPRASEASVWKVLCGSFIPLRMFGCVLRADSPANLSNGHFCTATFLCVSADVICLLSAVGAYLVTLDLAPFVGGLRIFVIASVAVFAVSDLGFLACSLCLVSALSRFQASCLALLWIIALIVLELRLLRM